MNHDISSLFPLCSHSQKTMAYEVPTDLIKQIQISTRAQAGLSGYDPGRASEFPGIPSLSEYVSSFDPSPSDLRCKHCKGRLLRGAQSLLCIYCGRLNDVAFPDPISFKDTLGYSWLLQSLHLDGSEMVEQPTEEHQSKRGHSDPADKIPLSDLLNLKISWPIEPEKTGIDVKHKKVEESNGSLRWAGVELDDFFLDLKRVKGSGIFEQATVSNQVKTEETKPVATHDNLSFFEYVQPSGSAFSSSKEKDNESSGWQADFQSTVTENQHGTSQSLGTSVDYTVDFSAHMDSVFGSGKGLKDKDLAASSVSVNQTSDDLWSNGSELFQQAGNFSSTISAKDTQKHDNFNNPSSTVDFSAHLDSVFGSGIDLKDENSAPSSVPITGTSDDFWNNGSQVFQQTGIFDSTESAKDIHLQDNFNNPSTSTDWFQGDEWKTNNSNTPNIGITNKDDDFDEWNDFTGSSSFQDAPRSAWTGGDIQSVDSNEKPSELSLFGSGNKLDKMDFNSSDNKLDKMDFNSFPEPDLLSGLSSKKEVAVEVNTSLPGRPASDRRVDATSMPDDTAGHGLLNVDILGSSTQPKDNVQMLISQMHDLSFMLKDELSVPSKSDKS